MMNVEEEGEQRHLLQVLSIITQEDMYMIWLLGQQKYINIVKKNNNRMGRRGKFCRV
jgi:hypothetical protein